MDGYYVAIEGREQGPFSFQTLRSLALGPDTLVWREGMSEWLPACTQPELAPFIIGPRPPAFMTPNYGTSPTRPVSDTRIAAGLCGIFFGALGVHKFILGFGGTGAVMLLVTVLTCGVGGLAMGLIGFIEGIIYLTRSDAEFYKAYVVERRTWF